MPAKALWENQAPLQAEQVKNLITAYCDNVIPKSIKKLGEGWDNTTWLINDKWCFRFPKHARADTLLRNEIRMLQHLPGLLFSIPRPEFIAEASDDFPYSFYGHSYLPGTTADRMALSVEERRYLAAPLAQFLKALHLCPVKPAIDLGIKYDQFDRIDAQLRFPDVKDRLTYLEQHRLITTMAPWLSFFESHVNLKVPELKVIGHGDCYARHLVLNDNKCLSAIIDWGDSELLHPAVDLALVYQFLPADCHSEFWAIYGEIDETTHILAQLRAIYSAATLAWYGHQIQDEPLMKEGLFGLNLIL